MALRGSAMGGDIGVLLTSNSTRDPIWACPAAVVPGRQQAEHADRPAVSAETEEGAAGWLAYLCERHR